MKSTEEYRQITSFCRPHARIWAIAGPAILANSAAPLVGLVDTWAIGHIPDPVHLASVGIGAAIFSYIIWTLGFLRMGTTGLIAQAHGKGDIALIAREIVRGSAIALSLALAVLLLQEPIKVFLFELLETPSRVWPIAEGYFDIRIWAMPATLLFLVLNGFLIGTARAKEALWLQLILNVTNGALNITFVVGFGMGVEGVALGTLIAEWVTLILGGFIVLKRISPREIFTALVSKITWKWGRMRRMLNVNSFILLRTILLLAAFMMVTRSAAELGEVPLAITHVMLQFLALISLGLDGLAYAGEALSGAALGAGSKHALKKWANYALFWAIIAGVIYSALFFFFGGAITKALTDIEVVRGGVIALMSIIVFLPIVSLWCYHFDGVFVGMTASRAMFTTMLIAAVVYFAALPFLKGAFGLIGVWLALYILMLVRGFSQAIWYHAKLKNI